MGLHCVVTGKIWSRSVTSQWNYKENERQGKCRKNKKGVDLEGDGRRIKGEKEEEEERRYT